MVYISIDRFMENGRYLPIEKKTEREKTFAGITTRDIQGTPHVTRDLIIYKVGKDSKTILA